MLSLRDLDLACAELDRVLDAGARFIVLPCGPAYGRSPGDPYFDPFWARVNEARAVIAYHISEFHYQANVASAWGWGLVPPFRFSAWQWQNTYGERPITDTLSALIFDNLFGRYPNIRVLVSEFGAEWVPHFIRHMDKSRGMGRNGPWLGGQLKERPSARLQGARPRGALPRGRHRRPRRAPRRHGVPGDGVGLAARRGPAGAGGLLRQGGGARRRRAPRASCATTA